MKKIIFGLVSTFLSLNVSATVISGSFTADAIEDYEGTAGGRTILTSIFGGDVAVIDGSVGHRSVNAGDWFDYRTSGAIIPTSGTKFGVQFGIGDFTLDFTGLGGITGFSGWSSAAVSGDDVFSFYDMSGILINSITETGGYGVDGIMENFSFVSTDIIGSIRLAGHETTFDDLGYKLAQVPEPATLALMGLGLAGIGYRRKRKGA